MDEFYQTLYITFKLAFLTTLLLIFIGIPIGYFLAYSKFRFKSFLEAIINLPLVLPPTVLGFYLILAFNPDSFLGSLIEKYLGVKLVFSFEGLVFASTIYSLPFMVNSLYSGFSSIPKSIIEASYTLGKSKLQTLLKVILPNMKPSILTGLVLTFAHTIGEFGVVLMIGGSIPGETKVASIAIYEEVESLNYQQAHKYALILILISFLVLLIVYTVNRRFFQAGRL
ncbi:MAG: molybdate ABC transporter permease subunit [Aquificota bacterium]|nr:MAG: molybdate ABC transporter permease subunit [Aquificota bacterium]